MSNNSSSEDDEVSCELQTFHQDEVVKTIKYTVSFILKLHIE